MTINGWAGTFVVAAALTVGLGALRPAPTVAAAQTGSGSGQDERVTITGCIERADQLRASTVGTTVDSMDFVLIEAKAAGEQAKGAAASSSSDSGAAAGPTGTAGADRAAVSDPGHNDARGSEGLGRTYRLEGDVEQLNRHVGHQVEISGSVEPTPAPVAAVAQSPNPDQVTPANSPRLKVESVRQLAVTCAR